MYVNVSIINVKSTICGIMWKSRDGIIGIYTLEQHN